MRLAASALVFALGLFALVAQTLLFRTWLGAFEGTELSLGAFFGSWLLWVAVGAWLARLVARRIAHPMAALGALALVCVPAFVLQSELTFHARELAGVPVYEVMPLGRLLGIAAFVNFPVSLLTGASFTVACRARAAGAELAVARVWVLECLGAFVGGLGVTLLLGWGVGETSVFGAAALALTLAAGAVWLVAKGGTVARRVLAFAFPPALVVAVTLGADFAGTWTEARDRAAWKRVLPVEGFAGRFTTAQARYLHGSRDGAHHVLAWGVTSDVVPDEEGAGAVVAVHLSQAPHARRVLVTGPGALAVVLTFARIPQVEEVVWIHPDPEYPQALREIGPRWLANAPKVKTPVEDAREHLRRSRGHYDLVLVHLPDVTTLVANRFATREFLELVEGALDRGGVASLRIRGGENVLGPERARLGASALATMKSVFPAVVLKPGEETFLLASSGPPLTTEPAVLRDRYAAIEGAASVYRPEALPSLWLPDRVAFQMERYREVLDDPASAGQWLNTDDEPKALLYGLLLAGRAGGHASPGSSLPAILRVGAWILAAGLVLFALLRVLVRWRPGRRGRPGGREPSSFDARALVFTTGLAGMAVAILWMFLYQSRYGTLYLHVGLVSSLFMVGLVAGGGLVTRLLTERREEPAWMLPAALAVEAIALLAPLALPDDASRVAMLLGVSFAGFAAGLFFPLAAHRLGTARIEAGEAGGALETADHLGGAVGATTTGLLLLPMFGVRATLFLLVGLVATNLAPRLVPRRARAIALLESPAERRWRVAGWVLAGVTLQVLAASVGLRLARVEDRDARFEQAARALAGGATLERETARLDGGGVEAFFGVKDAEGEPDGWILDSAHLAPDVVGYGGPIELAIRVDEDGVLRGWSVILSRETPSYVALLDAWREGLLGRNLFAPDPFAGVDAVSGATITADAVLSTLDRAGRAFARDVLHRPVEGTARVASSAPWRDALVLALLTLVAIALRWLPNPWVRRGWLLVVLAVGGLWLNAQYSSQQVFALLQGEVPVVLLSAAFYLVVVVPVVVLLFGNVYCGWICPFGAAQELLGDVGRHRLESDPHLDVWRWGRTLKYGLLALILLAAALSGRPEVLAADPLVTFFAWAATGVTLTLAVASLLLSLVYGRFFCRTLCPAGAFLAILNRVRLLRRWLPPARPGHCDLGVRNHHELDCLCCDRCRHA